MNPAFWNPEFDWSLAIDTTPLCLVCGQPMEWTGDEREVDLEGGLITVWEPIYRCVNPDCEEE